MAKLLVDGDIVLYRSAFSAEKMKYLLEQKGTFTKYDDHRSCSHATEPDENYTIWSRKEVAPLGHALAVVDNTMRHLGSKYPNLTRDIYLSPATGNFRERIATLAKYKGNRDSTLRPVYFNETLDYLIRKYKAATAVAQEADDELGIAATKEPGSIVCSIDKDLLQIPGKHYNWVTREEFTITVAQAKRNFWAQVISGDPADNVPGLSGYGEAKARAIVGEVRSDVEAWSAVLGLYGLEYGKDEGTRRALETARLVYIRRKEGEIWSPPVSV